MLRSKKDVDRHVQDILRKLQDENEKTLRCFKIAELYYNVNDYESARRYLSRYIEIRKEPKAHKLMGQILEALGQKEAAFIQYKYSFELNAKQEDLILKICELLAAPDVGIDVNQAKYWIDRADSLFPRHKIVFQLKEKVLSIEKPTNNEEDLENLISAELAVRPADVMLRVKLLKHYMDKGKLDDAYRHASEIEATSLHRDSLLWYQTLCDLFLKFKGTKQMTWNFWILYISSLERYAALAIKEQGCSIKKTSEVVQAVYNFDQHLFESKAQSFTSYPSLTEKIFEHMWGQLHFHMACLLMLSTKHDQGSWSEAGRLCAPLLLTALHVKPLDLTASWAAHVENTIKNLLQLYYREGSYRCSQAGHILQDYSKGNQKKLTSEIEKFCVGSWRERLYQRIFVGRIYQKVRTSYFTNNNVLAFPLRLISHDELKKYDEVAEQVWPYSLHHQVWPSIKSRNSGSSHTIKYEGPQPNLSSHLFPDLQFSVFNITNASPVTICRLDIDAFLNAAALCAAAIDEGQQRNTLLHPDRLPTLPADLTNSLCSEEQEKWWSAAIKIHRKDTGDDMGGIRQTLQRGLEAVRCIGNHGMHPNILVHLARVFQYRAKQLKEKNSENSDIAALESRSEVYWSAVVPLLERLQNNQTIRMSNVKLFDYIGKSMNNMELTHAIEEGKLLLAQKLIKDELYEQAIDALQALKCPEASFEQGKIYKKLADKSIDSVPKENISSEMRSQHIIILTKARNCFYLTLDRLRSPDTDPKHPLNAELYIHINAIENELKIIDPDKLYSDGNRNNFDDFSEESYSSAHSEERPIVTNSLPVLNNNMSILTPVRHVRRTPKQSSTPRHHQTQDYLESSRNRVEARPSPERLDAQIRQLVHSVESLKDQNREQHKAMISKLDELIKISARNLTKEAPKARLPPQNMSSTIEDELYGYGEDDYNFNTTPVQNAANRVFATPRHLYPPMVYPHVNPTALQNFFQGPLPFADPTASMYAANAAALAAAAAYPVSPMYRTGLEQPPIASMQQMTENLQQGLFSHRPAEYAQSQQMQQPQQPFGLNLNEPAKSEPRIGYPGMNEPSLPEISALNLKDSSVSAPALTTSSMMPTSGPRGALPVNVVITTSDTLPTTTPTSQPPMSVTIPAHHRLGVTPSQDLSNVPHSYQISMPPQPTILTTVNLPALSTTLTMTSPVTKTSVTGNQNTSIVSTGSNHSALDVTEVEHDPIPDFAPIVPLPDEVPVTTGEESEMTLFCARAKLFRFVDKEWKERGVGNVKLLKSEDGRVRLLMRREQVHKICANHMLRKDMELSQMPSNEKAYIWVANDFADEEVKLEKLCIKFKMVEEAANFKECFDKAIESLPDTIGQAVETEKPKVEKPKAAAASKTDAANKAAIEKFGGFTFTSSPVIQKPIEETKQQAPAKPSPFASLTFGKTSEVAKTPSFTFGTSTSTVSSAPLSNLPSQNVTKNTLEKPVEATKVCEKEAGEVVVLEQNAELMHFPSSTKIWNAKGKGVVKVLSESSSGRVRLLMNTEDNSKTILNEVIPETINFNLKADQVIWSAETKLKSDSYLLRFKNHEQASLFRATLQGQKGPAVKPAVSNERKPAPAQAKTPQTVSKNLFEQFKPPAGSWECQACYTRNTTNDKQCVACQTAAPGTTPSQSAAATPTPNTWSCKKCKIVNVISAQYCVTCDEPRDPSIPPKPKTSGGFSINALQSDAKPTFSFGMPPANQQPATGITAVAGKNTPSSFNFSFSKPQSETSTSLPVPIFGANKTATNNTGFSLGTQPPNTPPTSGPVGSMMKFGSPGKSFDFQFQPKSPQSPDRPETSDDEQVEESEDVYFAPVIPLPDKIEVKTGEEDEDVLYSHRAKLFKFDTDTKEWKERGIGEIKVLRHVNTKKLRLIMRRDQVLKLCLNHALSSAIEITTKDDKTWMWSAGDYSEGAIEYIQFACRFKTPEIAGQFKKAVDDACKGIPANSPKVIAAITQKVDSAKKESSQEIEIVYETTVTPEEKAAALKLRLPENFYAYKYKEDCPGCLGCREPEEPLLKPVDSKPTFSTPTATTSSSPFAFTSNMFGKPPTTNVQTPIFGTSTSTVFGGSKNNDGNAAKTTSLVFGQTSIKPDSQDTGLENLKICSPTTKQQTSTKLAVAATTSSSNIFGNFSASPAATATSGSSNIFSNFGGTNTFSSPLTNMFGGGTKTTASAAPAFTFSAPSTTNAVTNSIFGAVNNQTLFSASPNTFGTTNIFGGSSASTTSSTSMFGGSITTTKPTFGTVGSTASPMFGSTAPATTTTSTVFGASSAIASATPTFGALAGNPIFGSTASVTSATPIFGSVTSTTSLTPVFGAATTTTSATPVFGASTIAKSAAPVFGVTSTTASSPPFGTNNASTTGLMFSGGTSLFGGQTTIKPLFTAPQVDAKPATTASVSSTTTPATTTSASLNLSSKPVFGAETGSAQAAPTEGSPKNASSAPAGNKSKEAGGVSFLPTENALSFSVLAAQTAPDQKPAFQADPSFKFAGAGASVFGAKPKKMEAKKSTNKSPHAKKDKDNKNDEEEDDEDEGDENGDEHDPYFEPIVPLPDAIEVRTGEEDEDKLFCQRAKLYRFDQNNKEWKERGTGEMKLLHNVEHGTYRLLLRREQVFKVVCNVRLTADLEFHKLSTSNNAWVWAAMNYAEPDNPEVEKLAIKFKSSELAGEFLEAVNNAQRALTEQQNEATANASAVSQDYDEEVYEDDEYEYNDRDDYDEDEEGGEDDDDEDGHVDMFEKRATIYVKNEGDNDWDEHVMGNLRIIYDSDLFGVRILFLDDNAELRSDTVICMNTQMECTERECLWSATDYAISPPVRRTLKAVFSSTQSSHEMYKSFLEGKDCATKADIRE